MIQSTNWPLILVLAFYLIGSLAETNQKLNKQAQEDPLFRQKRHVSVIQKNPENLSSSVAKESSSSSLGNPRAHSRVVEPIQLPLTWDVSGREELLKVQSSFQPVYLNKSYAESVQNQATTKPSVERYFDCPSDDATYTLKQLYTVDEYTCSLMCYNIEEWDSLGVSEQTCISLSYCSSTQTCILLIKTDYNFTTNMDYTQGEGEQVAASGVCSATELMRHEEGCFVSLRNYMDNFEVPIRLNPNNFAYKTTDNSRNLMMQHEWLASFRVMETDYDQDFQSRCANRCHEQNSKPEQRVCLALDFCTRSYLSTEQKGRRERSYEITCNLFLVDSESLSGFGGSDKLDKIRKVLEKPSRRAPNVTTNPMHDTQLCNRFLLSPSLHQFNHLNGRKLSDKFGSLLTKSLPSLTGVNLDKCGSECLNWPGECFLFEYCNLPKMNSTKRGLCELYGKPERNVKKQPGNEIATVEETLELSLSDEHCRVYIRKDVGTLENVNSLLRSQAWGYSLNDFSTTLFALLLLLFPLIISVVLVASENRSDSLTNTPF